MKQPKFKRKNTKRAFSFAEMAVVVFLVIAISFMLLGKVFGVSQESDLIYSWKQVLISAQYSYKVTVLTQKPLLDEVIKKNGSERNIAVLNLLRATLNTKGVKPTAPVEPLTNYKYRFLNGKQIPDDSHYHVTDFVYSPNGKIVIGLNWLREDCDETEDACGVILFDLNGKKAPNRLGLDVFGVNIYRDRLAPFGAGMDYQKNQQNCQRFETGVTCSQFYLMGGQFFK